MVDPTPNVGSSSNVQETQEAGQKADTGNKPEKKQNTKVLIVRMH